MLTNLISTAVRHASADGQPTAMPRLTIWTADGPTGMIPALFEPEFYLLLQGAKRMAIADTTLDCAAGTSAVASVGLPFTSQVMMATPATPYLGIEWRVDPSIIAALLLEMPDDIRTLSGAISFAQVDEAVVEPLGRLLRLLDAPAEIPLLMPQYERELCYRLLQGPLGPRLRQIGRHDASFAQIKRAAEWIGRNAVSPMRVAWLAAHVGMSVTSFHRHFKSVTGYAPLAYHQHVRLLEARRRLATGAMTVTCTAFEMGYASASQFSREYKRAFGRAPVHDVVAGPV